MTDTGEEADTSTVSRVNMAEPSYTAYNREAVMFLGVDKRASSRIPGNARRRDGQQGYEDLMAYFRAMTLVDVREITLRSRSTERMWLQRMKEELESFNAGDLVTLVFSGAAGLDEVGFNESYQIILPPFAHYPVSFYKVFAMINGCAARSKMVSRAYEEIKKHQESALDHEHGAVAENTTEEGLQKAAENHVDKELYGLHAKVECDILLIMDAAYPDSITRDLKREVGTTTVLARSEKMTNARGKVLQQDGDFLTLLAFTLFSLVQGSNGEYKQYYAYPTLAQALKDIGSGMMPSRAHEYSSDDARSVNGTMLVSRPVLDMSNARATGTMQMLREYYQ